MKKKQNQKNIEIRQIDGHNCALGFFVGFVCSFLFSPDKSNLNFLFMTKKKLCTFPTHHQKAVHTSGLSPSAHAIQRHFESKRVSIK